LLYLFNSDRGLFKKKYAPSQKKKVDKYKPNKNSIHLIWWKHRDEHWSRLFDRLYTSSHCSVKREATLRGQKRLLRNPFYSFDYAITDHRTQPIIAIDVFSTWLLFIHLPSFFEKEHFFKQTLLELVRRVYCESLCKLNFSKREGSQFRVQRWLKIFL
jgi:hypothetical protein